MNHQKSSHQARMQEIKKKTSQKSPSNVADTNININTQNDASLSDLSTVQTVAESPADSSMQGLVDDLKKENAELKNLNLRLAADMQNLHRQHEMDLVRIKKTTKKEISLGLLDFVSNMNLALGFVPTTSDSFVQEFTTKLQNSLEKSLDTLKNYNIEVLLPKTGEMFNPEFMTGLNEPLEGDDNPKIKSVISAGLKIDGQVIKPVMITF